MPKKSVKKPAATKAAGKKSATKIKNADRSMAVALEATGLSQLKPIRPTRKTAIRPKARRTSR